MLPNRCMRGVDLLFRRLRAWNLALLPLPEKILIRILNDLDIRFEHRRRVGNGSYTLSFYLPDTRQAIQVRTLHAELRRQKQRSTHTAAGVHTWLKQERIPCLFVSDAELLRDNPSPVIRKIERFITQAQEQKEIDGNV